MQSFAVFEPVAVACLGAGGGVASAGLAAGAATVVSGPPLHCSTYAFSVVPRACIPALSARHSAMQSFAVFEPVAVAWLGAGGGAASGGLGVGAAAVGSVPPLHCST